MLFDFELVSRLGFSADAAPRRGGVRAGAVARTVTVWHLEGGAARGCNYRPLIRFDRPPEAVFRQQLQFLSSYADLRPDRAAEIVTQAGSVVPFFASIGFLRPDAKRWTMELLEVVLQLARYVEQRVKHGLACRRPNEYSSQVQPIILTPGHGSLPVGSFAPRPSRWRWCSGSCCGPPPSLGNPQPTALPGSGLRHAADAPRGAHRDQSHGGRRALPDRQRRGGGARPDPRRLFPRPRRDRTPTTRRISTEPRRTSAAWISSGRGLRRRGAGTGSKSAGRTSRPAPTPSLSPASERAALPGVPNNTVPIAANGSPPLTGSGTRRSASGRERGQGENCAMAEPTTISSIEGMDPAANWLLGYGARRLPAGPGRRRRSRS